MEPEAIDPAAVEEPAIEEPAIEPASIEESATEPTAIEQPEECTPAPEGPLHSKLTPTSAPRPTKPARPSSRPIWRSMKDSGAAYDFALDAEDSPEEYLRLVEAQGLKIQLRDSDGAGRQARLRRDV